MYIYIYIYIEREREIERERYTHTCMYYVYIYIYRLAGDVESFDLSEESERELEYRTPRLHRPVNSRRSPEISGYFCKNKASVL